ncbi:hypothetical protein [Anaeromyxobacter oryzae]|uniref:Uncharacterized protein n=1 Tax=Anaeromyxobacter oryzae TaxID=2918170 RepID=A0ABN6MLI8_9BACT|nr:hypothetical protein [Anaeromyxobacter oryzae]BDG01766.1 hypothetical protein AMOR_07620 [Anaeromyxobacter oryzae]
MNRSSAVLARVAVVSSVPATAPGPAPAAAPEAPAPGNAVDALRARLAGSTAREHVVLDFLEDDLREARAALSAVAAYVANVEAALADVAPSQQRLLSLALGGAPADRIEYLGSTLASVRRRLAQVAARM